MVRGLREVVALLESGRRHVPILVLGDVMLDQYVWGEVERISPEAPVPVLRAALRDEKPGGAANVAMNLAGLGACVTLAGFAGGDREQHALESLLAEAGIEPLLTGVPNAPTTTKLRILSGHQQMMRVDSEATAAFSETDYQRMLEPALAVVRTASVIVLSDYAKGALNEAVCQTVVREGRKRGVPVLVDPKSRSFERYRGATALCPNWKELAAAAGEPAAHLERILNAGQAMLPSLELQFMAVTLGEKGIAVLQRQSRFHAPAVARQVYDVSGAGDTVIAVLAFSMACGLPIETAVQMANVAAGVVVGKVGTVPIQREELLGALAEESSLPMDEKVLHLDRLLSRVATWRLAGRRVVFTNGCFDILHIGHIRLLEEARSKGDRLIVGLNSDDSVRRLKGQLRPIVAENERAQVLAALSAVDAVVVFSEDNPLRLIEAIRPDVLVKGGDYTEEAVIGAREVRAWGGRVELIPLAGDVSTTRLIARSVASEPLGSVAKAFLA
jgi:D-beta-D-heptose 7-phosphate kinase/D-beta-D-heptose 1-phosphate adenosyltransferase